MKERLAKLNSKCKAIKTKNVMFLIAILIAMLVLSMSIGNNFRLSLKSNEELTALNDNKVSINVTPVTNIDVVLTKGRSAVELTNFEEDLKNKLQEIGVNPEKVKVQAVTSENVESQNTFTWNRDVSSSIGNISITNGGANISMVGNSRNAGSNAIWIIPDRSSEQEFTFGYNIDFGDSFNAAGMLLRIQEEGNVLKGYMLSFNNSNWVSASGSNNGALWEFSYTKGAHSNITKTLVKGLNINKSGTLTVKATDSSISITGGGINGTETIDLPKLYGSGYGFFSDHYSHGCDNIGSFVLTGISLRTDSVKDFNEVLRFPEWRENSIRTIVNVSDVQNDQFNSATSLSSIVSRLLNDDISYIGWGTDTTKEQMERTIAVNDNNGIYIDNTDYQNAIQKTAEYIKSLIIEKQKQYIIAGEDVDVYVEPNNIMNNTKDENYVDGKWKVIHDYTYFENDDGQYEKSGMYTDGVITDFTKPGKYTIFYEDQEVNNSEIYVHRMPQASFDMSINSNNVTLTSTSYDLDKQSDNNGIAEEEWQYKKTEDSEWTSGKLTNIDGTSAYIVKLRVKDFQNTWSKATTKYIVGKNETVKPVADFIIKKPTISIYEELQVLDKSYDPSGSTLANYEWRILKDNNDVYVGNTIPTNYREYGEGEYQAKLVVRNESGVTSDEFIRSFTVKADTSAPEIIVNPTTKKSINEPIKIGVSFKDDESGFKSYKYVITDSSELVKDNGDVTWSEEIERQEDELTIDEFAKNQYLHIIATDNDGNTSEEKVFGAYYVQLTYEIQVQAIDNITKTGLQGVQFKIIAEQDDGTQIDLGKYDSTTNKDGKIFIKQVPLLGVNRITIETESTPVGYEKEDYKVATLDTTTYKIVVDESKTSNDLVSLLSDDEQTVTLKVAMKKKQFDLNITNKDKDNNNIKLNNSIFTLSYNGQEIAQGITKNGEVTLQGEIAGTNKTAEYVLNQSSVSTGYKLMTSTVLKISFDEKGKVSKIAQKWSSTNSDIIIDNVNIGNITVLNQMQSQSQKFNIVANVSNRENSKQKISGMKYKVIVEGEDNLKYEISEEASDAMGNINFRDLYGHGLVKLTFVNTATVGDYVLESIEKFITIYIDNDGKITNTKASMQGVYNKVEGDTVYVNLNNAKKQSINTIRIQVLNRDEKLVGYPGIEFEVRKLIDNSLIGKGTTNADGTLDIDGVMIDGNGDVAYKIIPLNAEENGLDINLSIVSISYDSHEKIENAEQISENENVNVYYKTQDDDDAYRHIANIEILQDSKQIEGTKKIIINKVDQADGTLLAGAKYKIVTITSETNPVVKTTDGKGELSTEIPDAPLVIIEITEIEAPVDYKLDSTTKTLCLQKDNDGNFNIVSKNNIEDSQITIDEDGNVIFTDKNVSMSNAEVKLNLEVTDESGKIALGGSEFKVTETKTGYSEIVTTGKDGTVSLPSAVIKSAGTYTFTVEQTKSIKPYAIPNEKYVFEVNFTMGGSFVTFNGKTDISGTEILLHNTILKQIPEDNGIEMVIPVKNTISNEITGLEYGIDLKKVDTKGNVLTGAFYDLEIRPFDTGVITIKDCEVKNDIEILKQVLSGETTTILLQQTKAELGYNVDTSLKVVSLYYDGKDIKCLNNTTSEDLQVNIIDKVIDGKTQKIIEITIVTPDPTTVKDPTENPGGDNTGTDKPGTDNPDPDEPGKEEPEATVTMHLFNKAKGTWDRTRYIYEWRRISHTWYSYDWQYAGSETFAINGAQRLPFFFDQTSYGFSFNQGTITKIKTQLIENGNINDNIYEESISETNEQDVENNGTDIAKLYKDYANKEVLITLQEVVPAYNFKKIREVQVKTKFDQNGKIISGEIPQNSLDNEFMAVAGISENGQTKDIKILTSIYRGYKSYDVTYDIDRYNCIGKNEMYCGILNEGLNNPPRININLMNEDTGEGLPYGAFTVLLEEKQYSEDENAKPIYNYVEKYNKTTDENGNISIVTSKTYANRTLRAYITEATPPTIGYYKYEDKVQGTLIVEMDFDDDGNIKETRYVDVPSNMDIINNANEVNVKVYNSIYYNFALNVTKIDENGEPLADVKFSNDSVLITDNIAQTGYSVFNYASGLTNEEGKTILKVCLPTSTRNNYYGKTIEYNFNEIYVPDNYKAIDGMKLRVLYDLKGNVSQVSTVSGAGDNIITVQGNTENTVDITVQNERIEAPTFMITNVDSENSDIKLSGTSYKIISWDTKEYESGTLNLKDEIFTNQTDSNGFVQVQMPNAHALRTIVYEIEEIDTAYSYIKNPKLRIRVSYDKDGNIIGTPTIIDNPSIGKKKVLTIVGQPNGNKVLQLQIINEIKPKFTINISKFDKALRYNGMSNAIFKAISQEKQADGTYLEADEERISVETDGHGYTKIGFKNAHNGKTMKYTIYEQKAEDLERGTIEVVFDVYGKVVSATLNGDYIYNNGIYKDVDYVNIGVIGETFRVNVNINADNAKYPLYGIGFDITTDMGEKNIQGITTDSYGQAIEYIGEVYKNKTVVYTFHQSSEAKDYNSIDDFSFAVTFDEQGEIVNCTPTSEEGKFDVLATQKDKNGINMSISINQYATDRQKMKLEVYDEQDTAKLISDVKYKVEAQNIVDASYETKDEIDIGPDKNFAGNSITYKLTQEATNASYVTNVNSIEVAVDYEDNGTIQQIRIIKSDGYVEIDESCYGSKTIKLKTQNRRKIITEIENINKYNTEEKIGGHMFNITSQKVSPNYSDMTITDQNGKGYLMPGPYYIDQTVEYKLEQINILAEFNKIEPITFKIKYDENGKAVDYEINDENKETLEINIPQTNEGVDFKLTVKSEPQVTVGLQTVDSKNNNRILGGKYIIEDIEQKGEVTTYIDKTSHASFGKIDSVKTVVYLITEKQAPLGYKYINRDNVIGKVQVSFDVNGQIIPDSISVIDGYDYIRVLNPTDKVSLYDIDLEIKYEESEEFSIIIENEDITDNTKKIVSTFNASISNGMTASTTTEEDTGYGQLQFGMISRDTKQNVVISQSNVQGDYATINTIGLNVEFDGSSKIKNVTPLSGRNNAICGEAYTIDQISDYSIKITVKNNPITKLHIQNVEDGNSQKSLNGKFELTGIGLTSAVKIDMDNTGVGETDLGNAPKSQTVHYTIKQVDVDKGYRLIKPVDLIVEYNADGKIVSASLNHSTTTADDSAVKVISYDDYNVNLQILNKQVFSIYANAIDAYNRTGLSGVIMDIKEDAYSNDQTTLTTDSEGKSITELGTNVADTSLNYHIKVQNLPAGYIQLIGGQPLEADVRVSFDSTGKPVTAVSSNQDLVEVNIENGLAVTINVKFIPIAKMTIVMKDQASKQALNGKEVTIDSLQMLRPIKNYTDANGMITCDVGGIKANKIIRYNISAVNQDKENYADLSALYVDVEYDDLGLIKEIIPSNPNIMTVSGEGTREIKVEILNAKIFKVAFTNVDFLENTVKIGGTYKVTSSKDEVSDVFTINNNATMVTLGLMYPGEEVTYTIHQEGDPQYGYEKIPDISFVVKYSENGDITDIRRTDDVKDNRILSGTFRQQATKTQAHADIEFGSKAKLLVELQLVDWIYDEPVSNIGFKIKDEESGIETILDNLSDENGILKFAIDSVYSDKTVNYTITQTSTYGGYKVINPISLSVKYNSIGTIDIANTHLENLDAGELIRSYTKELYQSSKLKGIQLKINMYSNIGLGIEEKDAVTGETKEAINYVVQEREIETGNTRNYNMITNQYGEAVNFEREVNTDIRTIEYTISQVQAPYGYKALKDFKVIVYYNSEGRVIGCDASDAPEQVNVEVSSDKLLTMSQSKEKVQIKITVNDDNRIKFKIVNKDANFENAKIEGSKFKVDIERGNDLILSNYEITTNADGIATIDGIEGPGNIKISFKQTKIGKGYNANDQNSGFITVNKAKETYTLTYVDSTDGIDYDVDSQYGDITVYLTNENNLQLNIIDVNAIDKSIALNSEISLKAQIGEKTETIDDIIQNPNNEITFEGTHINETGILQLNLGNTARMAGKKVVFTLHEETPATDYETYGSVTFTIEFDENGRIDKIYPNEQRVLATKKVDNYEANIVIGHGELQGKYSIKLIDESTVNNNRINDTQYHIDLSVDNKVESSYDMTTGTITMGGVVIEDGVAVIPDLEYEGKIDIALNIKEETEGYLGLKKNEIAQISFESKYDASTKMPILTNEISTNEKVLVTIDNIAKEVIVKIINDPVLDFKITNQDSNENLLVGAKWDINVTVPGDPTRTRTYGPYITGDAGELFTQLVRDYANETIDITLTQDKIYGMNKLEPIILTATINKDGKIEKLVTTQGQDNIIVNYGEFNIDIIVTNTIDKGASKIEINLDKVSSSNEEIKLKNAMFQVRITPEQGCAIYKIKQTDSEGKLNIGNVVAAGNIKIEIIEIMPPEGYKLGLNNGIYTFKIYKDVLTGNISKVESSDQNCEFNIDSKNGVINLGIVNESEAATISVEKLDSATGLKLEGAQFKLIDTNSGKESINTTNKKGIVNFPVDYQTSKTVIYKIIEMSAPQGYKNNNEEMTITVEYDNKGRIINAITGGNNIEEDKAKRTEKYIHTKVYNDMENISANIKPYEVEIIKTDDEDSNIVLPGTEFDINISQEVGINMNMTATTDSNGKINIEKIRGLGKINISLNETRAPNGYGRDIREKTIELQRDTETGELSIVNSNNLDVSYDKDNNKIIVKMSNKKESGKYALVINKTDKNQDKIESNQTEIEVKIGANDPLTYKTNDKGSIYLTNLQIPNDRTFNIYLTEKVAPDGYDINTKTQVITVETDEIYGNRQITNVKTANGQDIVIKKITSSIIELDMLNDIYHGLYLKSNKYIIGEKPDGYYEGQETEYKDGDTHIGTVASNTKLKDFVNSLSTNGEVSVRKQDGTLLQDDEIIKNGMTLIVVKGNERIELIINAIEEIRDVPYSLIINKTDMEEKNILSNETQFEITIGNNTTNTYQTDANGKITIENIKLPNEDTCDISIKEIVAPTGYELIQDSLKLSLRFESNSEGNRHLAEATTANNDYLKIKSVTTDDNKVVTINILNKNKNEEDDLYLKSREYIIGNSKPMGYTKGDETEYKSGIEYIYKVDPRTTLTQFINNLDTNGTPVVTKVDGTVLGPDELVGTDMKLTVTKGDKKIELIIAVKGDVSGDGVVTLQDYVTTRDAMVGEVTLTKAHMLAIDFSDDDEISLQDYVTERDYMVKEMEILS